MRLSPQVRPPSFPIRIEVMFYRKMNNLASSSYAKTSQARAKSQGWAAFDLKQRQKQPQAVGDDPFPPLSTNSTISENSPFNNVFSARSFSSVVLPSADFPPIVENADGNNKKILPFSDSSQTEIPEGKNGNFAFHSWADRSLIEDVMATVNNDVGKATTLLKEIVACDGFKVKWEKEDISDCGDFPRKEGEDVMSLLEKTSDLAADIADLSSTLEEALEDTHKEFKNVHATAQEQRVSEAVSVNMKLILGHLKSLPVEPEWEEDDVYLRLRRNALKMIRLASRHSRAATNAFIGGDHFSAQQLSLKARKEWLDAERLNANAAKEILSLRNSEDNPWKLDLHGLHAAEAVQALETHLKRIETQLLVCRQSSPSRVKGKNGIVCLLDASFASMNIHKRNINCTGFRQRQASLQVITGVGNHSRGQAALPAAVRNFLIENSYHFEETRPGVITVCLKFHQR